VYGVSIAISAIDPDVVSAFRTMSADGIKSSSWLVDKGIAEDHDLRQFLRS